MHDLQIVLMLLPIVLVVTLFLSGVAMGAQSGWYGLARAFPDREEAPIRVFRGQSGWMGAGLSFNGILTLSVCSSGLRVALPRLLGPFSRPFFVPWDELRVIRATAWLMPAARLEFGQPVKGTLSLRAAAANRIARWAGKSWPEPGPFPLESGSHLLAGVIVQWAVISAIAALGLTVLPRALGAPAPPLPLSIGLPALLIGIVSCVQYAFLANAADRERKAETQSGVGGTA